VWYIRLLALDGFLKLRAGFVIGESLRYFLGSVITF
jgi:hypothetical protein